MFPDRLSEKSLAQNLGQPSLIALAYTIERERKAYYDALERNNKDIEIADWLLYFADTVIDAQRNTIKRVDFYVAKAKLYGTLRGQLNERQEKVLVRSAVGEAKRRREAVLNGPCPCGLAKPARLCCLDGRAWHIPFCAAGTDRNLVPPLQSIGSR